LPYVFFKLSISEKKYDEGNRHQYNFNSVNVTAVEYKMTEWKKRNGENKNEHQMMLAGGNKKNCQVVNEK
jgi:hypothetical protein